MEHLNPNHNTILDIVFNYCKKETINTELPEIVAVKKTVNSSLIADDDPLLYYMSVSG